MGNQLQRGLDTVHVLDECIFGELSLATKAPQNRLVKKYIAIYFYQYIIVLVVKNIAIYCIGIIRYCNILY